MPKQTLAVSSNVAIAPTHQASTDQHLIDLWLHGRSPHTQRAYRTDVARFFAFTARAPADSHG